MRKLIFRFFTVAILSAFWYHRLWYIGLSQHLNARPDMIILDFYFREDFSNEAKAQDTFDKDRSTYDS